MSDSKHPDPSVQWLADAALRLYQDEHRDFIANAEVDAAFDVTGKMQDAVETAALAWSFASTWINAGVK